MRLAIVLLAQLLVLPVWASVDPDLFDGRVDASAEGAPSEMTENSAESESTPEPNHSEPEAERDIAESASVGGGEPVSGGSSKQAGDAD